MTSFDPDVRKYQSLKGKVVVLTGGANGIGTATVELFSKNGASVVFGDIDVARGSAIAASLPSTVHFLHTDVTSYDALLALFDLALSLYQRVDIAVSNAGVVEMPGWFDPSLDLQSIRTAPTTAVLDINLLGTLYFSRIAALYLRQTAKSGDDKSLILLSSVAGFKESPGIFVYQAAKHGVIGLMRSLRQFLPSAYGGVQIRVNCVCPWATDTAMIDTFQAAWKKEGLPLNTAEAVGQIIVGIAVDGEISGESIYVEGGRGWAFEKNLDSLEPEWLGKSASESLTKGQALLGAGAKWSK